MWDTMRKIIGDSYYMGEIILATALRERILNYERCKNKCNYFRLGNSTTFHDLSILRPCQCSSVI
jgi:hypothetical protein